MISCILAFYIAGSAASPGAVGWVRTAGTAVVTQDGADALYAKREDLASARQAERLWQDRLTAQPQDFDAAWKLARARYWLGGHASEAERRRLLEDGIAAARIASSLQPARPEGYFWMAANMGALAESFGLRQGLRYRGAIRDALLTVLKLEPAFQGGSADRALGRWYYKVPGLFGGSKQKSEEHLRKSLTYAPQSTASHFFLAETLFELGRAGEARAELQKVIDAPIAPEWAPEDREFKAKALARLRASNPKSQAPNPNHSQLPTPTPASNR